MNKKGFTLIELLVVITIMAILSIVTFINLAGFASEQDLDQATNTIQEYLRLAQANAQAAVKCADHPAKNWLVEFKNRKDVAIKCQHTTVVENKTLKLEGDLQMASISTGSSCTGIPFPAKSVSVVFTTPSGKVDFILAYGDADQCIAQTPNILVTLSKEDFTKSFKITQGGAIGVD